MCDYSLEMYRSRLASPGEHYVLHRFRSGTLGFIDPADPFAAVCMPAGARLRLEGFREHSQLALSVGRTAEVTIIRLSCRGNVHADGVRFADGREVLLQSLDAGLSAALLRRNLEAVFGLRHGAVSNFDEAKARTPIPAHALERFARYLTRLRLSSGDRAQRRIPPGTKHANPAAVA